VKQAKSELVKGNRTPRSTVSPPTRTTTRDEAGRCRKDARAAERDAEFKVGSKSATYSWWREGHLHGRRKNALRQDLSAP